MSAEERAARKLAELISNRLRLAERLDLDEDEERIENHEIADEITAALKPGDVLTSGPSAEDRHYMLLRLVFDVVKDPDDWRGPIRYVHKPEYDQLDRVVIDEAITFMTGTVPEWDGNVVTSVGYRRGPCGP